jgi:hypothetical protein
VGSTGLSAEAGVARQMSELAGNMKADVTIEALLDHIVRAADAEIPVCRTPESPSSPARSSLRSRPPISWWQFDLLQYQAGEGPCLDAARKHGTVRADDLRADTRWPTFATSSRSASTAWRWRRDRRHARPAHHRDHREGTPRYARPGRRDEPGRRPRPARSGSLPGDGRSRAPIRDRLSMVNDGSGRTSAARRRSPPSRSGYPRALWKASHATLSASATSVLTTVSARVTRT